MFEVGASPDAAASASLVAVSFVSYVAGFALRRWPEKIREYLEGIDGSVLFLSDDAHRAMSGVCGYVLILLSAAALAAAIVV